MRQEVERILSMPDGLAPDPNDKDSLGRTAMHLAAWAGLSLKNVYYLLNKVT